MKDSRIRFLPIAAALLIMAMIFSLSSQPVNQSDRLSRGIAEIIINFIKAIMPAGEVDLNSFNHLLRKCAHFFSYFLLGALGANAFRKNGVKYRSGLMMSIVLCVLFAFSDEAHQLFVPGRGAQLRDVAIDSAGAVAGILAYMIAVWLHQRRRSRRT